jgi:hypothetical protein
MVKPLVVGGLACILVGLAISLGLNAIGASGEVWGIVVILGGCVAGLIGAQVENHLPPPKQPR